MKPSLIDVLAITFVAGALFALFGREAVEAFNQVHQNRREIRGLRFEVDHLLEEVAAAARRPACSGCGGVGRCSCSTGGNAGGIPPVESPVRAGAEAV